MDVEAPDRRHTWLADTLVAIRDPFLAAHLHHRRLVSEALDLIAEDPYALPLRPYNGHDAPASTYVYSVPRTRVEIVFSILRDRRLGLFQLLDWEDALTFGPPE